MFGLLIGSYVVILIGSIISFLGVITGEDEISETGDIIAIIMYSISLLLSVILIMEGVC